jgi:holin-like protein
LLIIAAISFLGELLNALIPLPIPASIYGLVILFLALSFKIIKLEQVEETANFLIAIMLIFFVPPAVGIMNSFSELGDFAAQAITIILVSTVIVMVVTGHTAQLIAKIKKQRKSGAK